MTRRAGGAVNRRAGGAVTRRAGGAVNRRAADVRSPESTEVPDTEIAWDYVVDVICVGPDPGPVAHAISGVHRDRRVLVVARPDTWDADTAGYIAEMTAELPTPPPGPPVAITRARVIDDPIARGRPIDAPAVRGRPIDTFEGSRLRDWAAQCWASHLGVLYTDVVDETLVHTDESRCFEGVVIGTYSPDCALEEWLAVQARADGVGPDPDVTWRRAIVEYGRVAGVELDTASGPMLVRTLDGVALPTAPGGGDPAPQPDLPDGAGAVAIVGRPAGRFGRVQLLFPR